MGVNLRPLRQCIIVRLEGTENGKLAEYTTKGGIVVPGADLNAGINNHDGLKSRWAEVLAVGPECTEVLIGDRVLIDAGKWTASVKFEDDFVWMTEEEHIALIDDVYRSSEGKEKTDIELM